MDFSLGNHRDASQLILRQLLISLRQQQFMYFSIFFLVLMHQIHYVQGVQVRCCLCPSDVSLGVHVRLLAAHAATALWNVCANPAVLARSDPNTTPTSPPPFSAMFFSLRLRLPSSSPKEFRLGSPSLTRSYIFHKVRIEGIEPVSSMRKANILDFPRKSQRCIVFDLETTFE